MKSSFRLFTILALSLACISTTDAQYLPNFSPVAGQKTTIELDTPDGNQSEWIKEDIGSISALRATCVIKRLGKHKDGPRFSFKVFHPTQQKRLGYGLGVKANDGEAVLRTEVIYWDVDEKAELESHRFKQTVRVNEKFDVEVAWRAKKLRVAISNSEAYVVDIQDQVNKVYISSSTGTIRCNITLGTASF
ncbi:MAG: hypothetical protein K2X57_06540 [Xanthobacteraceae bacterium]|nr:hypothetical protein [Xanthobacteraceae bacterium]